MLDETEEIKKDYEIAFLLASPEASKDLDNILSQYKAEISVRGPINRIRLAYPIKKHIEAWFGFYSFIAMPSELIKIREALSLNSQILRFLNVTPPVKKPAPSLSARGRYPTKKTPTVDEQKPAPSGILSNELLEEKLEEILK